MEARKTVLTQVCVKNANFHTAMSHMPNKEGTSTSVTNIMTTISEEYKVKYSNYLSQEKKIKKQPGK